MDRLLTDAYMAQHPNGDSPQQRQSVAVHVVTLNGVLKSGQPIERASAITQAAVDVGRMLGGYPAMSPPPSWESTIVDVAEGSVGAREYVESVLDAWLKKESPSISDWTATTIARLYDGT